VAKDIGNVALTGRQVVAILLMIAAAILLLAAVARDTGVTPAYFFIPGFTCLAASVGLFVWNHRIASQPDRDPDILAQLFGPDHVAEMDSLHFWGSGQQNSPRVRVLVVLQNVYDARCEGRLQLDPIGTTTRVQQANLPLEFELGPAEVVAFWRDLPYPVPPTAELSFGIDGFIRKVRAPRIRFKRRVAIRSESAAGALTVTTLMTGHVGHFSGSRINIPLAPLAEASASTAGPTDWVVISLWSRDQPRTVEDVNTLIHQLLNG